MNRQRRRPIAPDALERLPSFSAFCAALPPQVTPCADPKLACPLDLYTVLLELAKAGRSAAVQYNPNSRCYYFRASKCSQNSTGGYHSGGQGVSGTTVGSQRPSLQGVPPFLSADQHGVGCSTAPFKQESVATPAASDACINRAGRGPEPASEGVGCASAAVHGSCMGLPVPDVVNRGTSSHHSGDPARDSDPLPMTSRLMVDASLRTDVGEPLLACLDEQPSVGQRLRDGTEELLPVSNGTHPLTQEQPPDGQPLQAQHVKGVAVEARNGPLNAEQSRTPNLSAKQTVEDAVQGASLTNDGECAGPTDGDEVVVVISTSCQALTPGLLNTIALELAGEGGSVVLAFVDSDGTTAFIRMYRGIVPPEEGTFDEAVVEADKKRKRRKQHEVGDCPDV